jgi:3-oxoacyl-[acyl-carrier-protein] synthase I
MSLAAAPVYLSGFGLHTALGRGMDANLAALRAPLHVPQRLSVAFATRAESIPYYLLADQPETDPAQRLHRSLHAVVEEALREAHLTAAERGGLALYVGTSSGEIALHEANFERDLKQDAGAQPLSASEGMGYVASWLVRHFGLQGADYTINTACTASANALMHAAAMIRVGRIERALVVGIEVRNAVTALGFQGLQLLSKTAMQPFDRRRDGIVLGEGCAAVVVQRRPRTPRDFSLRGEANLCDTHSISAANPDGSTIGAVIEQALANAQVRAADIAALKVHGTASPLNDEAEIAGTRRVFSKLPVLCALKPRIGHTLGACGLTELALLCAALRDGWLPGTPGVCAADSDLDVALNQAPLPFDAGCFMLNYFGFGGNNTSLVVAKRQP